MKELLALLLCFTIIFTLAACGGTPTEESKQTESASEPVDSEGVSATDTAPSEEAPTESESAEQPSEEAHDHNHISFNGQVQVFTPEQMPEIIGREHDFTYDQNGSTIYIYNNLTIGELTFTQAQFTFNEDHNRISCTYTIDSGSDESPRDPEEIKSEAAQIIKSYEDAMIALYGEGTHTEQHGSSLISWSDHTGNYVILTQINDTTVQLAFYLYAK